MKACKPDQSSASDPNEQGHTAIMGVQRMRCETGAIDPNREPEFGALGLRIALFSGNYNCVRDGANKALNKLVAHLIAQGGNVRVYSPSAPSPAFVPSGHLVSVPSIPIPGRSEFRAALGMPRPIREDLDRFSPNLIHVSAPDWLGTDAQFYALKHQILLVASMHTRFETYFSYYGLKWLRNWAWRRQSAFYKRNERVLAPNQACARYLVEMGVADDRIDIWGRGIDSFIFTPHRRDMNWRRSLGYKDDEPIILFFGRLVREKGLDTFVRSIEILRDRGFPIRPLVIGEGPAEEAFEAQLGSCVFTGHLEGPLLGRAIASADILLNPSVTEAFGNVNLEAMACGLAVVSADVATSRALISNGENGLLFPGTPSQLADGVETLLLNSFKRSEMSRAATLSQNIKPWSQLLDSVIGSDRKAITG